MSFHLSADGDIEERLEDFLNKAEAGSRHDEEDGALGVSFASTSCTDAKLMIGSPLFRAENGDSEKCSQDGHTADIVDWDDGNKSNDEKLLDEPTAVNRTLSAVTIDLRSKLPSRNGRYRRRGCYRFASLPFHIQSTLQNLHRAHWLTLICRGVFVSSHASNEVVQAVAYSLIPALWNDNHNTLDDDAPTLGHIRAFCGWYFDLVHCAAERLNHVPIATARGAQPVGGRRAMANPPFTTSGDSSNNNSTSLSASRLLGYCSYLSSSLDEEPRRTTQEETQPAWNATDRVSLLIAMFRSLGWRARYVASVDPVKLDLDLDHPMVLNAMTSMLWEMSHKKKRKCKSNDSGKRKVVGEVRCSSSNCEGFADVNRGSTPSNRADTKVHKGWVEILCRLENSSNVVDAQIRCSEEHESKAAATRGVFGWVHVDPETESVDQPHRVEALLYELEFDQDLKRERKKRKVRNEINSCRKERRTSRSMSTKHRRPVVFVVAAEHVKKGFGCVHEVTDVTFRYSQSMVDTLVLRGIPSNRQEQTVYGNKGTWWSQGLQALNRNIQGSVGNDGFSRHVATREPSLARAPRNTVDEVTNIRSDREEGVFENSEFSKCATSWMLPSSKQKFRDHPMYVLKSVLKSNEVLAPDANSRACGFFKGEMVFKRSDVSVARPGNLWLYQGRKVRESELTKPVKRVRARAKSSQSGCCLDGPLAKYGVGKWLSGSAESQRKQLRLSSEHLGDEKQDLYASWQTDPWRPPLVGPEDEIPVNHHKNVEGALLNPGLAHINAPRIVAIANQLGITSAPCLLGFEGGYGNRTPLIRGIVVHQHNADLLHEASVDVARKSIEDEKDHQGLTIFSKWKALLVGVLMKDRLDRDYK